MVKSVDTQNGSYLFFFFLLAGFFKKANHISNVCNLIILNGKFIFPNCILFTYLRLNQQRKRKYIMSYSYLYTYTAYAHFYVYLNLLCVYYEISSFCFVCFFLSPLTICCFQFYLFNALHKMCFT